MLSSLVLTAALPCAVLREGVCHTVSRESPLVIPAAEGKEICFTLWGEEEEEGRVAVPKLVRIRISESGTKTNVPLTDWGDVIEAELAPLFVPAQRSFRPLLIDTAEVRQADGKRVKAELFTDGGLVLAVTKQGGAPAVFGLGEGFGAELGVLDVGSARIFTVKAVTPEGQRLIAVNTNAETVLDAASDSVGIYEGRPVAIEKLGTVRGHEKRTAYEFEKGIFSALPEETGFFSAEEKQPENDAEKALSLCQEVGLGLGESFRSFLDPALSSSLPEGSLAGFLGDFRRALLYPLEERNGRVTVGLVREEGAAARPAKFVFCFENGLIADICEI